MFVTFERSELISSVSYRTFLWTRLVPPGPVSSHSGWVWFQPTPGFMFFRSNVCVCSTGTIVPSLCAIKCLSYNSIKKKRGREDFKCFGQITDSPISHSFPVFLLFPHSYLQPLLSCTSITHVDICSFYQAGKTVYICLKGGVVRPC